MSYIKAPAIDELKSYLASKIILMSDCEGVFNEKDFVQTLGQISHYVSLIEEQFQDGFDEWRGAGV